MTASKGPIIVRVNSALSNVHFEHKLNLKRHDVPEIRYMVLPKIAFGKANNLCSQSYRNSCSNACSSSSVKFAGWHGFAECSSTDTNTET